MGTTEAPPAYYKGHGERVAKFVESHIRQTKGRWAGEILQLEPWQRDVLDELYLVDEEGNNVYREGLLGLARKNGKSTLMSAIALYGLLAAGENGAEVYCAAASKDQARIVFNQAREFVEGSPELRKWLTPQRNLITCSSNNGIFRVLSSDAPLQHGLNPSLVVIDELWAHTDPELYYALTTGQLARENPLVISITTAGFDRDSICWDVYERAMEVERKGIDAMREERFFCRWFEAPADADVDDEKSWALANPASWIKVDDLRLERKRLPEFVFRRLHLNQWTDLEDAWVSPQDWDKCVGKPLYSKESPAWMGVDIGLKRDATAIIWVQWHGDDLHIHHNIRVPTEGKALSAESNRAQIVEQASKMIALREIAYDPWSFTESAEMLEQGGLPMVEYQQNNAMMCPASERLYELIVEGRLVHDGDPLLRHHVLNTVVAQTERGWRISKRESNERIDASVAMTMAADRAILTRTEVPPNRGATFL